MKNGSDMEMLVRRLEKRLSAPRWPYLLNIIGGFLIIFIAAIQARGYLHEVWLFIGRLKSGTGTADSLIGLEPTLFDAGLVSALIGVGALNIAVGINALKSRDADAVLVHLYREKVKTDQGVVA